MRECKGKFHKLCMNCWNFSSFLCNKGLNCELFVLPNRDWIRHKIRLILDKISAQIALGPEHLQRVFPKPCPNCCKMPLTTHKLCPVDYEYTAGYSWPSFGATLGQQGLKLAAYMASEPAGKKKVHTFSVLQWQTLKQAKIWSLLGKRKNVSL